MILMISATTRNTGSIYRASQDATVGCENEVAPSRASPLVVTHKTKKSTRNLFSSLGTKCGDYYLYIEYLVKQSTQTARLLRSNIMAYALVYV